MAICRKPHRYDVPEFEQLPADQGGDGRHKCAGCAFDLGVQHGRARMDRLVIDLDSLPESQAGTVRHRSPHAAYALGYLKGVYASYGVPVTNVQIPS